MTVADDVLAERLAFDFLCASGVFCALVVVAIFSVGLWTFHRIRKE